MNHPGPLLDAIAPGHDRVQLVRMGVKVSASSYVVALAGNPNTGKSTVFNSLTGLRQHTGNWPGKTVTRAEGGFVYNGRTYKMVDLPGTYSLLATSVDEEIARDFLLFGRPDVTVVVVDACRLERNLNLALQVLEITDRVVICLNLMDEARRKRIAIDADALAHELGVPVTPAAARYREGIDDLLDSIDAVATGRTQNIPRRLTGPDFPIRQLVDELSQAVEAAFPGLPNARWVSLRLLDDDRRIAKAVSSNELGELTLEKTVGNGEAEASGSSAASAASENAKALLDKANTLRWRAGPDLHQRLVEGIYVEAAAVADRVVTRDTDRPATDWDRKLDGLLTNRWTGFPIMILLLGIVLWLTVAGANLPSAMLSWLLLDTLHPLLKSAAAAIRTPLWLDGLLLDGVYLATAWVVSVMLPPMAIFFPLFTLLEDFGYLPRVAFNLDKTFRRCGAHGKQALTMCMGFGCNAAGVVATRVIDSPRERLLAIITNNFSLCNGRWPTQILVATIFLGALVPTCLSGFASAASVVTIALLGIAATFATSWLLSRTLLRGEPSSFHLELPPYRPPRILQTLYTSLIDRTIIVLWRAIVFAVPAGAAIWLIANIGVGGSSLAEWAIAYLDPVGIMIGLNGVILLAYVVAIPANEIVIPTILMLTVLTARLHGYGEGAGVMFESESTNEIAFILRQGGWTVLTAVNLMLFSLLHNPCSTTIFTIWKETRSARWTVVASLVPLVFGFVVCYLVTQVGRLVETW
jgi:ferrous iron transport protein B